MKTAEIVNLLEKFEAVVCIINEDVKKVQRKLEKEDNKGLNNMN